MRSHRTGFCFPRCGTIGEKQHRIKKLDRSRGETAAQVGTAFLAPVAHGSDD
jgi:hypothetical protein